MKFLKPSFAIIALLISFPQLSETIYTPSLPWMARQFSTSANIMQFTLSIYFIGFACGVFCFGLLCDAIGRRKSMIIGLVIYTLASLTCALSSNIEILLLSRFIQAVGASVGSVVTMTIIRDLYQGNERNKIFSKVSAIIAFAPAIGPVIGIYLSSIWSPLANFWFLFGMGIVLFFIVLAKLQETKISSHVQTQNFGNLFITMLKDRHIWFCAFFVAAHNGIIFSIHAEAPFIFLEMLSLDAGVYGFLGIFIAGAVFLGSMINTKLLRVYSPNELNFLGTAFMAICATTLLGFISCHHLFSVVFLRAIFLLCICGIILGLGISLPNCLSIGLKNYGHALGRAGAIFGLFYYLMIGAFLGVMGFIHNGTLWPLPLYFFVLTIAMAFTALLNIRSIKAKEKALA